MKRGDGGSKEEREDVSKAWDFFVFCLNHIFAVKVQELACSASYGINETLIPNNHPLHRFMGETNTTHT